VGVKKSSLYILKLQPELHDEFFAELRLPTDIDVKVYKTYKNFIKAIGTEGVESPNLLLFVPEGEYDPVMTRRIRLIQVDSPIYVVTPSCDERQYLKYLTYGISGVFHPPFSRSDVRTVLNGRTADRIQFPRIDGLIREGQVRLDFLVPSKLSRILGVNRLVSFLSAEFGFPPEDSKVNLPLVVDEAMSNAILHGNSGNEDLKVHVRIYISSNRIVIRIEDQGEGFSYDDTMDPTGKDNILKGSGRGIYLIRELMDSVVFKKGGRAIEMEKSNPITK